MLYIYNYIYCIYFHLSYELTNFRGAIADEKRKLLELPFVDFITEAAPFVVATESLMEALVRLADGVAVAPMVFIFGLVHV